MSIDASARSRVPAGVRTGGRFATEAVKEADTTLTAPLTVSAMDAVDGVRDLLARKLGVAPDAVEVTAEPDTGVAYGTRVELDAAVAGSVIGERVQVAFTVTPDGRTTSATGFDEWQVEPRPGYDLTPVDCTAWYCAADRSASPAMVETVVHQARRQGRMQRYLNEVINLPQVTALADAIRDGQPWTISADRTDILELTAVADDDGRVTLIVQDRRSSAVRSFQLDLDDDGVVVAARVEGPYGWVRATDPTDLVSISAGLAEDLGVAGVGDLPSRLRAMVRSGA